MIMDKCKYRALSEAAPWRKWGHLTQGLDNPMENDFVHVVMEGERRTIGKPPSQRKEL